jgi:hypothetical protein
MDSRVFHMCWLSSKHSPHLVLPLKKSLKEILFLGKEMEAKNVQSYIGSK